MDSNNLLGILYRGTITAQEFNWEMISPDVSILQLIPAEDINRLRTIITSASYAGNSRKRLNAINEIMKAHGFTKFAGGTNRLVYTHFLAPHMVFKVAVDAVGINDNPAEFYNQQFLKPFCTKVFECSPCGTIASFQKVRRITTLEEFNSIFDDYYRMLKNAIIGKYVMEDIGTKYFMNFGIVESFGPVILDFPYLYELDGDKLYCNATLDDGSICHGEIDYTSGFNSLVCTKCGRTYRARDLAKSYMDSKPMLLRRKGGIKMRFHIKCGGKIVKTIDTGLESDHMSKTPAKKKEDNSGKKPRIIFRDVKIDAKTKKVKEPVPVEKERKEYVPPKAKEKMVKVQRVVISPKDISGKNKTTTTDNHHEKPKAVKPEGLTSRIVKKPSKARLEDVINTSRSPLTSKPAATPVAKNDEVEEEAKGIIEYKPIEKDDTPKEEIVPEKAEEVNFPSAITVGTDKDDVPAVEEKNDSDITGEDYASIMNEYHPEDTGTTENPNYVVVHFVTTLPIYLDEFEGSEFTVFAKYMGEDPNFKPHVETLKYPINIGNDYDVFALMKNSEDELTYHSIEFDKDGNFIIVEEDDDAPSDEDSTSIFDDDDAIRELRSSEKRSVEDMLNS